ncbi:unnamed protein product [Amoebophrya sp. A25]|nr:unnamed protein product [Amoebophrya sp. A25]|eukprot:GSA25T00011269001.1
MSAAVMMGVSSSSSSSGFFRRTLSASSTGTTRALSLTRIPGPRSYHTRTLVSLSSSFNRDERAGEYARTASKTSTTVLGIPACVSRGSLLVALARQHCKFLMFSGVPSPSSKTRMISRLFSSSTTPSLDEAQQNFLVGSLSEVFHRKKTLESCDTKRLRFFCPKLESTTHSQKRTWKTSRKRGAKILMSACL